MNKYIHVETPDECKAVLEKIERDYPEVRWHCSQGGGVPTEFNEWCDLKEETVIAIGYNGKNVLSSWYRSFYEEREGKPIISAQEYLGEEGLDKKASDYVKESFGDVIKELSKEEPTEEEEREMSFKRRMSCGFKQEPTPEEELTEKNEYQPSYCSNCGHKIND